MNTRRRTALAAATLALITLSAGCTGDPSPAPTPSSDPPPPPGRALPSASRKPALEDPLTTYLSHPDQDFSDIVNGTPLLHEQGTGPRRYLIRKAQGITAVHVFTSCSGKGKFRTSVDGKAYWATCPASEGGSATVPIRMKKDRLEVVVTVDQSSEFWLVAFAAKNP